MSAATGPVIVVDDDAAVRHSLKFALELEGLKVRAYDGGASLLAAIRTALKRQEQSAERDAQWNEVRARLETLSERERQVLEGLVAGKANKVIAYDLGISPRTVEIYRANVMGKMQAGSLSELVRMALLAGVPSGGQTEA